ncbi:MAG: hypothetical protein HY548_07040 [Elusimicrobia bacterium]|nr:hypothetical protein [Elusimicrobiota bacterium]
MTIQETEMAIEGKIVKRLLMLTQLLMKGFPPAVIQMEDQHKYYYALSRGDMGDFKNLIQLMCESVVKGYRLMTEA